MPNLLWPGDHRAGEVFSDAAVAAAMVEVERVWLGVLVEIGIAPAECASVAGRTSLHDDPAGVPAIGVPRDGGAWALDAADLAALAADGENAGNPAVALVSLLRSRVPEPAATWLHRGLTSQDVLDTVLMLCAQAAVDAVESALAHQISRMADFVSAHRHAPMVARTLTQPAIPTTIGVRAAAWLTGLADAADALAAACPGIRAQIGGAAGTLAAVAELAHGRGLADPPAVARRAASLAARRLNLADSPPWHTARIPLARLGDALVSCTDAWGRLANDVATGSRAEIGEFAEGAVPGRGGSSTMPGKHNPVLSVLLRRAALAAPPLAATLHLAAAAANDDRPDGAWHAEWDTLRILARRTVAAARQATELIDGLAVDEAAAARHLAAASGANAEQRAMAALTGREPVDTYTGAADLIIDAALARAHSRLSAVPSGAGDTEEADA